MGIGLNISIPWWVAGVVMDKNFNTVMGSGEVVGKRFRR